MSLIKQYNITDKHKLLARKYTCGMNHKHKTLARKYIDELQ
jgi:hypothetical protein